MSPEQRNMLMRLEEARDRARPVGSTDGVAGIKHRTLASSNYSRVMRV